MTDLVLVLCGFALGLLVGLPRSSRPERTITGPDLYRAQRSRADKARGQS